jgi:hypothetical protein
MLSGVRMHSVYLLCNCRIDTSGIAYSGRALAMELKLSITTYVLQRQLIRQCSGPT